MAELIPFPVRRDFRMFTISLYVSGTVSFPSPVKGGAG